MTRGGIVPALFRNLSVQREISKKGFRVLDDIISNETDLLLQFINNFYKPSPSHFNYSLIECSYEENKLIRDSFRKILQGFYDRNFIDYRTLNESFLIKPAKNPEELQLHQDWCYTDETKFAAYNIWIPLCDVTETNGAMFFLPGSHLWFDNYRSSTLPTARISTSNFSADKLNMVELKKGQVLLFHPAIFHGSYPNLTGQNRIVVTSTIMPAEAPFLYYNQAGNNGENEIYSLSEDAYLNSLHQISVGGKPDGPLIKRFTYSHHLITPGELIQMSTNANFIQREQDS